LRIFVYLNLFNIWRNGNLIFLSTLGFQANHFLIRRGIKFKHFICDGLRLFNKSSHFLASKFPSPNTFWDIWLKWRLLVFLRVRKLFEKIIEALNILLCIQTILCRSLVLNGLNGLGQGHRAYISPVLYLSQVSLSIWKHEDWILRFAVKDVVLRFNLVIFRICLGGR